MKPQPPMNDRERDLLWQKKIEASIFGLATCAKGSRMTKAELTKAELSEAKARALEAEEIGRLIRDYDKANTP